MKLNTAAKTLFLVFITHIALGLGHIKTFFLQDNVEEVWPVLVYQNYILYLYYQDIVQVNIETGIVERTLRGHDNDIFFFEISKGSNMATVDINGRLCVWDLESGSITGRYEVPFAFDELLGISFGQDYLFLGSIAGSFHKLDLVSKKISALIVLPYQVEVMIAYGNFLFASVYEDPFLFKINGNTGRLAGPLNGHLGLPLALAVDGNYLVSAGQDGFIILWNADFGSQLKRIGTSEDVAFSLAIHKDFIYTHTYEGFIVKWHIGSGARTDIPQIDETDLFIPISFYENMMFIGTQDQRIVGLDQDTGEIRFEFVKRRNALYTLAVWKNFVISGGSTDMVEFWDTDSRNQVNSFAVNAARNNIYCLHVCKDFLFSGGNFSAIFKWFLPDASKLVEFHGQESPVYVLLAVDDILFSGGTENDIFLWNLETGAQISKLNGHSGEINDLFFADQTLFSGSDDKSVKLWNTITMESEKSIPTEDPVFDILVFQDALYTSLFSELVKYSIYTGEKLIGYYNGFSCFGFETDGTMLYTGCSDSRISIRTLENLVPIAYLYEHTDEISSLAWGSNNVLFSAGLDGAVRAWNLLTRSIAYRYPDYRLHVVSMAADRDLLFAGLFDGALASFNISSNLFTSQTQEHQKTLTSLLFHKDRLYSAGMDGLIKRSSLNDEEQLIVYQNRSARIRQLISAGDSLIFLSGSNEISILPLNNAAEFPQRIVSPLDLQTLASSHNFVFAGTQNGMIFAWDIFSGNIAFKLQNTTAAINSLLIERNSLFAANDDGSIYEWSIESLEIVSNYTRIPSTTLGHVGPVISMALCNSVLFTGGSDYSIGKWNITSHQLEDLFFGPAKPVTLLYCNNISLFAGTVDSGVYMFDPGFKSDLPPVSTSDYRSSQYIDTMSWRPPSNTRIIETLGGVSSTAIDSTLLVVLVVVSLILIVLCVWYFRKKRGQMKKDFSTSSSAQLFTNDENRTATDLNTFVNTSVGISKHAALEIPSEYVAVVKKIATGGGAGVFLAKLMDSNLAEKHGEDVIQKRVFIKSKLNEEAFYQEVGIMVMLSSFPHFCSIIGYTLDPMAIILKFYPDGSLANFIRRRSYGLSIALKASMDVAQALSIMHSHSLAHCDIKPHNILIEINNRNISFVLTDFGITQVLSEKVIATKMFHTVNLRGLSANYASPEAFVSYRSKHYTRVNYTKYDIFSYACIIYELLVKSTPWSRQ